MTKLTDQLRCLHGTWSNSCTVRTECLLLLLSWLLISVSSFSCPWPCEPEQDCTVTDISTLRCQYGIVFDACRCCRICGQGPGEVCGLQLGNCGSGLECVKNFPSGLSRAERDTFPGECMFIANTTVNSTQTTEEASTSATLLPSTDTITELPTNLSSTSCQNNTEVETNSQLICQPKCSIDYCTGTRKHRICAAAGLAYSQVDGRGRCQHTSCRACFLHVQPNCTNTCREYPNKKCLKRYYLCVRNFLFDSGKSMNDLIIKIDDPNVRNYTGRLVCYVPDVDNSTRCE